MLNSVEASGCPGYLITITTNNNMKKTLQVIGLIMVAVGAISMSSCCNKAPEPAPAPVPMPAK